MRRALALLLVLIVVPLPPVAADEPTGETLAWDLLDCVYAYGTATLPAARLAPYMPRGFRPFFTNPVTAGQVAQVGVESVVCASGAGVDGAQVPGMTYASTWAPVTPIADHRVPGAIGHFVNWEVLVPDAPRREALRAHDVPAHDGSIDVGADLRQPQLAPFRIDYALDGAGSFAFDIVPQPQTGGGAFPPGEFVQYTPSGDHLTYWRTRWTPTSIQPGVGIVTLSPDSWQAAAFGTTQVPARFTFGTWSYTDGRIVLDVE